MGKRRLVLDDADDGSDIEETSIVCATKAKVHGHGLFHLIMTKVHDVLTDILGTVAKLTMSPSDTDELTLPKVVVFYLFVLFCFYWNICFLAPK